VIGAIYRRARRKAASFLNGWLMPRAGLKLVRSYPKSFRYEKTGTSNGCTALAVTGGSPSRTVTVRLREGTSDWTTCARCPVTARSPRPIGSLAGGECR
jgi:hypothetical protein